MPYWFTMLIKLKSLLPIFRELPNPRSQVAQEPVALEPVALTIHVHDGDLNGTLLADVLVGGQDAAGNSFEGMTDSNGTVLIGGVPGTWQFTFSKEGYETLSLSYNATVTEDTGAYLMKSADSQENPAPAQSDQ